MSAPLIVIVGPTAVGKTRLSIDLAKALDATIVSGDAFQLYRTLDIATAKATAEERRAVPHRLVDILEPDQSVSVASYQAMVRDEIDRLRRSDVPVILVGGSGLYVQSVLFDYRFPGESRSEEFERRYEPFTNAQLKAELMRLDPQKADAIHENNRRRLLRAIQIATTATDSEPTRRVSVYPEAILIGLRTDRATLNDRINRRVDRMMELGLLEEAKRVYERYRDTQAAAAIGYKELFPYFDGASPLAECVEAIRLHSRQYAKRQMTWFQNQMDVTWFPVDFASFAGTTESVLDFVTQKK